MKMKIACAAAMGLACAALAQSDAGKPVFDATTPIASFKTQARAGAFLADADARLALMREALLDDIKMSLTPALVSII